MTKETKPKTNTKKRLFYLLLLLALLAMLTVPLLYLSIKMEWIGQLPDNEELKNIETPEASDLIDAAGVIISKYYKQNRINIDDSKSINPHFKNALIATEDIRFYKHNGVDLKSLFRVFFKTLLLQNKSSGGGSTITQQLVKNTFPRNHYSFGSAVINKFREMIVAKKLEKLYSKDEILKLYTNTVSFGEQAFGLEVASKRFFNKNSNELDVTEAASLVGILKAPTYYSPRLHPERCLSRRNVVLSQMLKSKHMNQETYNKLNKLPLNTDYQTPSSKNENARYFKEKIRKEFDLLTKDIQKEDGSNYNLYKDGLKVYTTLDSKLQKQAEAKMKDHMKKLQKAFIDSWAGGKMYGEDTRIIDDQIKKTSLYKSLKKNGVNSKDILDRFTSGADRNIWTWDGYNADRRTKIDSIKHYLSLLHCGILAADPQNGAIKVWIGGNDYGRFQLDNINSPRQVGSTFKPIVYLTALEQGVKPCQFYKNELRNYTSYKDWTPKNANNEYGGAMSMYAALVSSINTISVQVLFDAGINNVVKVAEKLGIKNKIPEVPSIVLGTSDVSLYEMVKAYSHFANGGVQTELYSIEKIEDKYGKIIYARPETEQVRVLEEFHVDVINSILSDVTKIGTGRRIALTYQLPFEMAGKTGTTQSQSDGWFIGYHPNLVVGAWVGTEDRRMHFKTLSLGSGSNTSLPIVAGIMKDAHNSGMLPHHEDFVKYTIDDCPPEREELEEEVFVFQSKREKIAEKEDKDLFRKPKNNRKPILKKSTKDRSRFNKWLDKLRKKN